MVSTKCNGVIKAIVAPMDLAQPALCHKIKETVCIENYGSTIEMLLIRMTSSADCRGSNCNPPPLSKCCRIKNPCLFLKECLLFVVFCLKLLASVCEYVFLEGGKNFLFETITPLCVSEP